MSIFISVGILILAMLIMASLQLTPGVFAIFSHYNLGKFKQAKAYDFMFFFILGVETITACLFISIYYLTFVLRFGETNFINTVFAWVLAGIMFALSLSSIFLYYRRGHGTKLFISRKYAKALEHSAKTSKTRSDAFLLGSISGTYELFFTFPIYIIAAIAITQINISLSGLLALAFILSPLIPLFCIYIRYRLGYNLANIIKSRTENKSFIRFLLCTSYLFLAILIIYAGVI